MNSHSKQVSLVKLIKRGFVNPGWLIDETSLMNWLQPFLCEYFKVKNITDAALVLQKTTAAVIDYTNLFIKLKTATSFLLKFLNQCMEKGFSQDYPALFVEINKNMLVDAKLVDGIITFDESSSINPEYLFHFSAVHECISLESFTHALVYALANEDSLTSLQNLFADVLEVHLKIDNFLHDYAVFSQLRFPYINRDKQAFSEYIFASYRNNFQKLSKDKLYCNVENIEKYFVSILADENNLLRNSLGFIKILSDAQLFVRNLLLRVGINKDELDISQIIKQHFAQDERYYQIIHVDKLAADLQDLANIDIGLAANNAKYLKICADNEAYLELLVATLANLYEIWESKKQTIEVDDEKTAAVTVPVNKVLSKLGFGSDKEIVTFVNTLPTYFSKHDIVNNYHNIIRKPDDQVLAALENIHHELLIVSLLVIRLINLASDNTLRCNTNIGKTINYFDEIIKLEFDFINSDGKKVHIPSKLATFKEKHLLHGFIESQRLFDDVVAIKAEQSARVDKINKYKKMAELFMEVIDKCKMLIVDINKAGMPPKPQLIVSSLRLASSYFQMESFGIYFQKKFIVAQFDICNAGNSEASKNFFKLLADNMTNLLLLISQLSNTKFAVKKILDEFKLEQTPQGILKVMSEHELINIRAFSLHLNKLIKLPTASKKIGFQLFNDYFTHLLNCFQYCMKYEENMLVESKKYALLNKKVFELMKYNPTPITLNNSSNAVSSTKTRDHSGKSKKNAQAASPAELAKTSKIAARHHDLGVILRQLTETAKDFTQQTHGAQSKFRHLETHGKNTTLIPEEKDWRFPEFGKTLFEQAVSFGKIAALIKQPEYSEEKINELTLIQIENRITKLSKAQRDLSTLQIELDVLINQMKDKLHELDGGTHLTTNQIKAATIQQALTKKARRREEKGNTEFNGHDKNLLQEACKKIIYMSKILQCSNRTLPAEIKHYALLYNIFWCFQALKFSQRRDPISTCLDDTETIGNLRQLLEKHGATLDTYTDIELFATNIKNNLSFAIVNIDRVWEWKFSNDTDQNFLADVSVINRQLTDLHGKAAAIINYSSSPVRATNCVNFIKSILARITMLPDEHEIDESSFLEFYLFEIQALRMLVMIGSEIMLPRNADTALKVFLEQCKTVRNAIAQEPDSTVLPIESVKFIIELKSHIAMLVSNKALSTTPTQRSAPSSPYFFPTGVTTSASQEVAPSTSSPTASNSQARSL
jgi:hypothetical protein